MDDSDWRCLFEDFVKGFAQVHLPNAKVSKKQVPWDAIGYSGPESVLPKTETDVTIDQLELKLIIECKFYKDGATVGQRGLHGIQRRERREVGGVSQGRRAGAIGG